MKKGLLALAFAAASVSSNAQNCADIFISEYVEGTENNKAIELYNPTNAPIDLGAGNYSMGRDRDGAGVPMLLPITGIIPAYGTRVFVLDKRDPNGTGNEVPVWADLQAKADTFVNPIYVQSNSPFYFNGDDAFVLVKGGNTLLDIIGEIGFDPGSGWSQPGDPFTRWWTVDNTLVRKYDVQAGVTVNPTEFDPSLQWDSIPVNVFDSLGTHNCACAFVNVREIESRGFALFPNPIHNNEFVLNADKEIVGYSLMGLNGILAREEKLAFEKSHRIRIDGTAKGLYILEIVFADGTKGRRKVMVD
jgi:hypothetical protein